MARYMRIPQYFGQATDILFYGSKCQYDSLAYYKKIVTIDGVKALNVDGDTDYILAKFDSSTNGWFPQVGSTFFLKFMLPEDSTMWSTNFGILGSGDSSDSANNDFWGLSVRTEPLSRTKMFYLTISDLLQQADIPFKGFTFDQSNFPAEVFHSIALVMRPSYAQLYVNGLAVSRATYTFTPATKNSYDKIYVGRFGNTTEFSGMKAYIKEIGLWSRPIEDRDIYDLNDQSFIVNKGVSSTSKRIKISAGKFYYDGYIHSVDESSIFIDGVGTETVYLVIKESLITEEEDPELLDNSANTYNLGKPGMHRIKFEYSYSTEVDPENLEDGTYALKFLEFEDGVKTFSLLENDVQDTTESESTASDSDTDSAEGGKEIQAPTTTSEISSLLATYLYEMLGNFIYSGLSISMMDNDDESYQLMVGSGVYYLNGKRYSLDTSIPLNVSKNASLTSVVNEYISVVPDTPILLSQQPVAATYVSGGDTYSGVTRALVPIKLTKEIRVTRTNVNGEDIVDASAIKVLAVYKGGSSSTATTTYTACSSLDSSVGDYFFHNGRIKWSPSSNNKPTAAVNGVSTDSYKVDYIIYYSCTEGVNNDFILIKGDRLATDTFTYRGKNITHSLQYKLQHIVSLKATVNGNTYTMQSDDVTISGSSFIVEKDIPYLETGATIEIYYSYNSSSSVKPNWHIVFFNTGTKEIVTDVDGLIDYKYFLSDIYTLAIDRDNVFRLYKGTPGYRGNVVRAAISDTSLPLADIVVDPDGSEYCTITSYNIYRTHVTDIRSLSKKISDLEDNILLTELEKTAEGKSDINTLKGMYVDALANYSRANLTSIDAFIDLVRERLYSGFESQSIILTSSNPVNAIVGKEVYFPVKSETRTIVDYQHSYTGDETVNKILISSVKAQVSVYNDYSYNQELESIYIRNAVNAIKLSQLTLIPTNSETSILNSSYSDDTTSSTRSSLIQRTLAKFNTFFDGIEMSSLVNNRTIVLVGRGFGSGESNITLKVNGKTVDSKNLNSLSVSTDYGDYTANFYDGSTKKTIKFAPLTLASGWSVNEGSGITANSEGEFVVSVLIPYTLSLVTGIQNAVLTRTENPSDPINVKLNFNGILNSLRNVVNTGSRGNITAYDSPRYSSDYIPSIIQPINSQTETITGLSLYFSYIDYSAPILIDLYEMQGTSVKSVLYRKAIYSSKDFQAISDTKYTILLETPINILASKSYAIGISTENTSVRICLSEIGKVSNSSEDKNTIVSRVLPMYSVTNASGENFILSSNSNKGIMYDVIAIDQSSVTKGTSGYVENTIRFDDIAFDKEQDRFSISCDFDPTIGYDRKIEIEYSIDQSGLSDSARTWTKILPYTLIVPDEKFTNLAFRFLLSSGNNVYTPSIPCYPVVNVYKFMDESAYYSKTFDTGIEDGSGDNSVDIYVNAEYRAGSEYSVAVSPDTGITWRPCTLIESTLNGSTSTLTLKEDHYKYECRIAAPVVESHEIVEYDSAAIDNGEFSDSTTASYLIALLDSTDSTYTNEVYNVSSSSGDPESYEVYNFTGSGQKVKLKINIDSNCKGFRVYRSLNGSTTYYQIYSSIAKTSVPSTLSQSEINPYEIPLSSIDEFPNRGVVRINNELIKYTSISGNKLIVTGNNGRGYKGTTVATVKPGDVVELADYAEEHEDLLSGSVPRIYSSDPTFEFVDDNKRFRAYNGRAAKESALRGENETNSYPGTLSVRLMFENSSSITESSSLWDLICNIKNA